MDQIVLEKKNLEDHLLPVNGDRKKEALVGEQVYQRIWEMLESGKKKKVLARLFGIDIKTVRKIAVGREWQAYQRRLGKPGLLEPYQDWIRLRAPEVGFNGRVILRELKEKGYTGSYDTLKHFLAPLRPHRAALEMTVRFETRPGQQAQVDWGSSLVWMGEAQSRIRFFVMTLGYSRRMFVRAFSNERLTSLIEGHEEAFRFFGGVTEEVLYDNPKTMVLRREDSRVVLNTVFEDFARHWGYTPRFCRPYRPQTKGKVESGIKYVKRNFLAGRRFRDLEHLNEELERWNREEADLRIHGTTGCRPLDRFPEETLVPCPAVLPYLSGLPSTRTVTRDGWVTGKGQRYSVPLSWGPVMVRVREEDKTLVIGSQEGHDVRHALLSGLSGQCRLDSEHHQLPERPDIQTIVPETPHQHDPRWQEEEVEIRDLATYDLLEEVEVV